jgi:hypothetical protein
MTVIETTVVGRSVRDLLTDDEFQGVVATVLGNNADMATATAEQITEEGLKFLVACSEFPEAHLRPSQIVDEGWHALILHTRLYATLCEKPAGGFVHHLPERRDPTRCTRRWWRFTTGSEGRPAQREALRGGRAPTVRISGP